MKQAIYLLILLFTTLGIAQERLPGVFTYQGRAFQADGVTPLSGSATFSVQVRSANGNCLLYQESHVGVDLTTSAGFFALNIGDGTASSGLALSDTFANLSIAKTTLAGTCGGAYTPLNQDSRVLRITVDAGGGPIALDDQYVYTAPQALVADTLSGFKYDQFVQSLSTAQRDALTSMVNGTTIYNISTGRFNRYNGASWIEAFGATNVGAGSQIYSSKMAGNDWLQLRSIIGSAGVTATQNANDITLSVDTATIQARVTGTCGAGNFITAVAADGTVTCAADSSGSGTVTSVTNGDTTITIAGTAADPTVALATCGADNQILKMNGAVWNCEADAEGLTSINVGTTLSGNGVGTALNVAANAINHDGVLAGVELLAACGAGEILKYEGIVNGWECASETTVSVVTANTVPVANAGATDYVNSPITVSTANVGIATAVSTARLHLPAGTAAAGTSPLKLTSGTNLTAAEAGAIEFDGTNLYFTDSVPTRRTIATTTGGGSAVDGSGTAGKLMKWSDSDTATDSIITETAGALSVAANSASTGLAVIQSGAGYAGTFMGGNVGIGTTTPGYSLQVISSSDYAADFAGSNSGWVTVRRPGDTAGTGLRVGISSANEGQVGTTAARTLSLITNNTQRVSILSTGNVGIGTTTPAQSLEVVGNIKLTNSSGANSILFPSSSSTTYPGVLWNDTTTGAGGIISHSALDNATSYGSSWLYNAYQTGNGAAANLKRVRSAYYPSRLTMNAHDGGANGALNYLTAPSGAADADITDFVSRFFIRNSTGNIGVGTTSPTAKLHLPAGTTAAGSAPLKLTTGVNLTTPEIGAIEFDGTNLYFTDSVPTRRTIATSSTLGSYVLKAGDTMTGPLVNNSNSASTALAVTQSGAGYAGTFMGGNVGIGTASPTKALQIQTISGGGGTEDLEVRGPSSDNNWGGGIRLTSNNTTSTEAAIKVSTNGLDLVNRKATPLRFFTNNTETARIDATGKVGIGTTLPAATLDVLGSATSSAMRLSTATAAGNVNLDFDGPIIGGSRQTDGMMARITQISTGSWTSALAFSTRFDNVTFNEAMRIDKSGNLGIGVTAPTAALNIKAGTTVLAPLQLTAGTNLTTPLSGAIEFDGTNLYFTDSVPTRRTIATSSTLGSYVLKAGDTMTGPLVNNSNSASTALAVTQSGAGYAGTFMGGNVGIGTTAPTEQLDLTGNIKVRNGTVILGNAGQIVKTDNTGFNAIAGGTSASSTFGSMVVTYGNSHATLPGYLDLYPGLNSGSPIRLFTSPGSEAMRVTTAGNVGIGTSAPTNLLHLESGVAGPQLKISTTVGQLPFIRLDRPAQTIWDLGFLNSGNTNGNGFDIKDSTNNKTPFSIENNSPTGTFVIRASGNVGIGTTTPGKKLEVTGDAVFNTVVVGLGAGASVNNIVVGRNALISNTTGSENTTVGAYSMNQNSTGSYNTVLGSAAMQLGLSSRNTAIGANALKANTAAGGSNTAVGEQSLSVGATGDNNVALGFNAGRTNTGSQNLFLGSNSGNAFVTGSNNVIIGSNTGSTIDGLSNTILVSTGAGTERMRIDSSGNVGIGVTSSGYKLDVNGDVQATAYYYTSDARKKENINTLQDSLNKIIQLRGVNFNWISDGKPEVGLIAQEVESVYPDLVATDAAGWKAVKYGNLVAPLIESTKELYGMCKMQEEQIAKIEAKIQSQDRRIASVETVNDDQGAKIEALIKLVNQQQKQIESLQKRLDNK